MGKTRLTTLVVVIFLAIITVESYAYLNANNLNNALIRENDRLELEYDELNSSYVQLSQAQTDLEADYRILELGYEALQTEYETVKSEYTSLQSDQQKLLGNYNDLLDSYNTLEADYSTLDDAYSDLLNDYNDLVEDWNELLDDWNALVEDYETMYEARFREGYNVGYSEGNLTGYNIGYIQGLEEGAGKGYTIRDPTYQEALQFMASDRTDENQYNEENYTCTNFAADFKNNAFESGYRCGFVEVEFPQGGHAIVCFNTVDEGMLFMEPQTDEIVELTIAEPYWNREIYEAPTYDDTVVRFVIVW